MIPTEFEGMYHKELGAGGNPNTQDLKYAVCTDKFTPGVAAVLSCWEPSQEEIDEIVRTRRVWVACMAPLTRPTMPPIWVIGTDPVASGQFSVIPYIGE
jgi:hypothetical protein